MAIPETIAAERIASLVGTYLDPRWLTDRALQDIAAKIIAARPSVRSIFDELDADPKALATRDVVLKQQRTAEVEDQTWWLEQAHYYKQGYDEAIGHLRAMGANPRDFDPDARDIDREDDRLREERQDEAAARQAPRIAS